MAIFGREIPIERVSRKKNKNKAKKIRAIALQIAIEKDLILLSQCKKTKQLVAPKLFCILNVPITFSLNLLEIFSIFRVLLNFLNSRNNLRLKTKL